MMAMHRVFMQTTVWCPPAYEVPLKHKIIRIEKAMFEHISPRELADLSNVLTACNIR